MRLKNRFSRLGLAARAMAFVTLALLPLGLIAIWQTDRIIQNQSDTAERALLAITEKAAARERRIIERAIGAAAAMGNTAHSLKDDPAACRSVMASFEQGSALYSFAGFTPASGSAGCHSGQTGAYDDNAQFAEFVAEERLGLYVKRDPENPDASVLVIATPAFEAGRYVGHLRLHVPHASFETTEVFGGDRPLGLITFSDKGEILTSERVLATARDSLPDNVDLQDLIADDPYTFTAVSANEIERTYAFVPLTAGNAYALGTWNTDAALLQGEAGYWRTIILAALMWLGSVLVIFLIMQLLVIRGIKRLRTQVRSFRDTRTIPAGEIVAKGELYDLEVDIVAMAETIVRDEAELEDAVHEKNVLLKEVHHRVKNNLQLINSIINMILRGAKSPETRTVVKRLQDRVMALASVHRTIYQAQSMDRVDASEIVREIVNQGVAIGLPRGSDVDIRCNLSPVSLYPDQAMPLSLLVSEAITNALKYVGGDNAFIAVDLSTTSTDDEDGTSRHTATLRIANTVGDTVDDDEGTGLGSQLLRAFTHQLDGEAVTSNHSGLYSFSTTFNISAFNPEESDFVEKRAEED